jgi:hypothetical protein
VPVSCKIGLNVGTAYGSIFCLHEGELLQAGQILLDYYTTEEKVRRLISLGDLHVLGHDPGLPSVPATTPVRLSSMTTGIVNTECWAYIRDAGERHENHVPRFLLDLEHWIQYYHWSNYNYFFQEDTWWVFEKDKIDMITPLKMQIEFEKQKPRMRYE